jgi:signal transduction histidine kinase
VLDDRGLVAAIRERVAGPGSVPAVEVDAPEGRLVLPAAVESAALRIAQEAVANVRRHAAAAHCTVTLGLQPGMLRLDVVDDGRGLPDHFRAGVGLGSMHERAAEVRGTVEVVRSPDGGTRVTARLPVPAAGPT